MVHIPLLGSGSEAAIGAGKLHDGSYCLRTCHLSGLSAFKRGVPADCPSAIERMQRIVDAPACAVIEEPAPPGCNVSGISSVPLRVGECEREL